MNRQFVVSVVVLFVLSMVLGFVVHGLIIGPEYAKLAPALLLSVAHYLIYFAVQPMPSDVVAQQVVLDGLSKVVLGIGTAYLNRV